MNTPTCPRCRVPLQRGVTRNVVLHVCSSCGGAWLDNDASKRIVEYFEGEAVAATENAAAFAKVRPDVTQRGIPCPCCSAAMGVSRVAAANVDIDYCPQHGTWFDPHELQQVSRAMAKSRQDAFLQSKTVAAGSVASAVSSVDPGTAVATAYVAGSVAGHVAGGVAEVAAETVASGVLELTFEIVCGILSGLAD